MNGQESTFSASDDNPPRVKPLVHVGSFFFYTQRPPPSQSTNWSMSSSDASFVALTIGPTSANSEIERLMPSVLTGIGPVLVREAC